MMSFFDGLSLFEDEGSITVHEGRIRCRLATPNHSQINEFSILFGIGKVTKQIQHKTDLYVWGVDGKKAKEFLFRLLPWLSGKRREQALMAMGGNL